MPRDVGRELERQDAHDHEVAAVDAFEARGDGGADAQEERAFGGPVAAGAAAVFGAGEDDHRRAFGFVFHGGVVDRHDLAVGQVAGDAAFGAGGEQVADADVGERAAGHHAIVAAAGAVAVEVARLDAVLHQVFAGGAVFGDRAGGRDVVGRDRVAERAEQRAPLIGLIGPGSDARSTRNGGSWM